MKTKNDTLLKINAFGKGVRLEYLEKNPHGFSAVHKVHKSDKKYSRKKKIKDYGI